MDKVEVVARQRHQAYLLYRRAASLATLLAFTPQRPVTTQFLMTDQPSVYRTDRRLSLFWRQFPGL